MEAALQAIVEAVRHGMYLSPTTERDWHSVAQQNGFRVAQLRLLAWAGWKPALGLLKSLPTDMDFMVMGRTGRQRERPPASKRIDDPQPPYPYYTHKKDDPDAVKAYEDWGRRHAFAWRDKIPLDAFKKIGPKIAEEVGARVMRAVAWAVLGLTRDTMKSLYGFDPVEIVRVPYKDNPEGSEALRRASYPPEHNWTTSSTYANDMARMARGWHEAYFWQVIPHQEHRQCHEAANILEWVLDGLAAEQMHLLGIKSARPPITVVRPIAKQIKDVASKAAAIAIAQELAGVPDELEQYRSR